MASIPHIVTFLLYSLSFFFIDFGPNTTTFILPTELFPTRFRTFSHGISAAAGKAGAGISVLLFPSMLEQLRVSGLLQVLGVIAILGGVITAFIEEPKGYPLEEVSSEELVEYEDIK